MQSHSPYASSVIKILCAFTLSALLLCTPGIERPAQAAGWFDFNWSYRKKVTIDHTKVGGNLTNFPVLIGLDKDSDLASNTQADGDDILFTSSDGTTKLDHEVEKYEGDSGELLAWVRIPTLSSTADTEIYMYYGNPSATNQENGTEVWDDHFHGVWHLSESASPSKDSTSYANHGNGVNSPSYGAAGMIDGCVDFGTKDCGVVMPDNNSLDVCNSDFTVSVWCKKYVSTNYHDSISPFCKCNSRILYPGTNEWCLATYDFNMNDIFRFAIEIGTTFYDVQDDTTLDLYTWYHVVGVRDGTTLRLYVNGVEKATASCSSGSVNNVIGRNIIMGYWERDPVRSFRGSSDEARISFTARSAEWIQTCYANQADPSSFIKRDDPEPKGMP